MILRRLIDAFRRQDWVTAFIEFLIVVVGIFVALQVDNWAGAAAARKAERAALERLFSESQKAYEDIYFRVERTKRINGIRRNAVAFIDNDAPIPENTLPIKIGINTLGQFPEMVVLRVVHDELKSSGRLQLIQSAEIRDSLSSLHAAIDTLNKLQNGFGDSNNIFWNAYRRHVDWRYNPDANDTDIILSNYNWESLRQDREFITIAIGQLRNQVVTEEFLSTILVEAREACELIGKAIEATCTEPPASGQ